MPPWAYAFYICIYPKTPREQYTSELHVVRGATAVGYYKTSAHRRGRGYVRGFFGGRGVGHAHAHTRPRRGERTRAARTSARVWAGGGRRPPSPSQSHVGWQGTVFTLERSISRATADGGDEQKVASDVQTGAACAAALGRVTAGGAGGASGDGCSDEVLFLRELVMGESILPVEIDEELRVLHKIVVVLGAAFRDTSCK